MRLPTFLLAVSAVMTLSAAAHSQGPRVGQLAPELIGKEWRGASRPLTIADLRGKVVLVHFWTLGCINCKHNLPAYNKWQKEFKDADFQIVGIHTPETDYERSLGHLEQSISERGITYPVLIDNEGKNWRAWDQEYWPAIYLIDKRGRVRDSWQGEFGVRRRSWDGKTDKRDSRAARREIIKCGSERKANSLSIVRTSRFRQDNPCQEVGARIPCLETHTRRVDDSALRRRDLRARGFRTLERRPRPGGEGPVASCRTGPMPWIKRRPGFWGLGSRGARGL